MLVLGEFQNGEIAVAEKDGKGLWRARISGRAADAPEREFGPAASYFSITRALRQWAGDNGRSWVFHMPGEFDPGLLRKYVDAQGLTQVEVARQAGLDETTVHLILKGRSRPWTSTVEKLADAVGVMPRDFARMPQVLRAPQAISTGV